MSETSARVSIAVTAQVRSSGVFSSTATYPASFERYLTDGSAAFQITKAAGDAGTVSSTAKTVDLAASGMTKLKFFYVENTSDPSVAGTANVVVAGGPVSGTVPRGQVMLATNDVVGWAPGVITLTGTAGTTYKLIALGS
jgi:hypothetical protein